MGTRILLIRHASKDAHGRFCGSFDVPLSQRGREQLQSLLRKPMARPAPDALFSSTLRRAQTVAAALARAWRLQSQDAEWAREIHCGEVEGMLLDLVQRRFPELWARNEAQNEDGFAWPGGESYGDFRARIIEGLAATAAAHPSGRVAVVTHAGVISQVLGIIRRRPAAVWESDRPQPLTATEITWTNGAPSTVLSYDDPDWF